MNQWLSYYHPSTIMFVDDQKAFLAALKNKLPKNMPALFHTDPYQAIEKIIETNTYKSQIPHTYTIEDNLELGENINDTIFNLKLGEAWKTISNPQRFANISVVIVDRMMPQLDGISFCRKLINEPVKKIMLTASKDHKVAVQAFNEGLIDLFLLKDSPNLVTELITNIDNMQKNYFANLTKSTLGATIEMAAPFIKKDSIIRFIQNMMMEFAAVEFYLLDKWGSTLFIKEDGTPITLVIAPEKVLDTYAAIAQSYEEDGIAKNLISREKILFLPKETDSLRPISDWNQFLFDAIPFPEEPEIFYSIITSAHYQPSLPIEQIYPYQKYKQLF